jgi:hypothetical protein
LAAESGRCLALGMVASCGGAGLGGLPCAETPSRASYGLTVACRTDERGSAADDGQANDARLSQTVGARQTAQPGSLGGAKDLVWWKRRLRSLER